MTRIDPGWGVPGSITFRPGGGPTGPDQDLLRGLLGRVCAGAELAEPALPLEPAGEPPQRLAPALGGSGLLVEDSSLGP